MDNVIPFPNKHNNLDVETHSTADVLRMCVIRTHAEGVIDLDGMTHLLSVLDTIEQLWESMAE
jgi:hypothetical protein